MLLNIPQCTGQSPQQRMISSEYQSAKVEKLPYKLLPLGLFSRCLTPEGLPSVLPVEMSPVLKKPVQMPSLLGNKSWMTPTLTLYTVGSQNPFYESLKCLSLKMLQ